jgi:hypothetical protein
MANISKETKETTLELTGKFSPKSIINFFGGSSKKEKDMSFFGKAKVLKGEGKSSNASKIKPLKQGNQLIDVLLKIYNFLKTNSEQDTRQREIQNNFAESNLLAAGIRHKKLLDALEKLKKDLGVETETATKDAPKGGGLFDGIIGFLGDKAKNMAGKVLGKEVAKVGEKAAIETGEKAAIETGEKAAIEAGEKAAIETGEKAVGKAAGETAQKVGKEVIEKEATKVLEKGLGKTVAKSIPFLGIAAGAYFAADKLMSGDLVGAGLEFVGGAGSALTAIPASIASAARDVYNAVYGVFPESDPNAGPRLKEIYGIVEGLAKKMLGSRMKPVDGDNKSQTTPSSPVASPSSTPDPTTTPTPTSASPDPTSTPAPTSASPAPTSTPAPTSAAPVTSAPSTSKLNAVQSDNNTAKIAQSTTPSSKTVNNVTTSTSQAKNSPQQRSKIPPVRNLEESFQKMITYSTRVV